MNDYGYETNFDMEEGKMTGYMQSKLNLTLDQFYGNYNQKNDKLHGYNPYQY